MSAPLEHKKALTQTSVGEYLGKAPVILIAIGATFTSLGYGLYSMVTGNARGQSKGMSGRIGFQALAIAMITATVHIEQTAKAKREDEKMLQREQRKLARAQRMELKAQQAAEIAPVMTVAER
eukprot:TRINITY_DN3784_c0_g1_i1.p1 TRINITY_DN3784_c0_g1~~TRINITY_DN3784_c0_g1_i1.p1  ORF type:complete len:123 (-),score=30.61 TRINITY_DN3784_c0_g1_i1:91-459(-)